MKIYNFPYLSSIKKWRFRLKGSSILTLSKFYLKSSVGIIASWFGGWKIIKFRPQNGVKSSKNRSQKRRLVAKRLRKAFWTETWPILTPYPPGAGLLEGGRGMDKSIPEGWYLECYIDIKTLNHLARWAGGIIEECLSSFQYFWFIECHWKSIIEECLN